MSLSRPLRWLLALTLVATVWVALEDAPEPALRKPPAPSGALPARKAVAGSAAQAVAWPLSPAAFATPDSAWPQPKEGARYAWQNPAPPPTPLPPPKPITAPPPPAVAAPAAITVAETAPSAPRFPFKLIGQFEDQGQKSALLSDSRGAFPAVPDQVIDQHWRVIAVNNTGLDVVWLPNGQILKIGYQHDLASPNAPHTDASGHRAGQRVLARLHFRPPASTANGASGQSHARH